MKKILTYVFIAAILLAFAACSTDDSDYQHDLNTYPLPAAPPNARPPTVAINGIRFVVAADNERVSVDRNVIENAEYDGRITSKVGISELPTENEQGNSPWLLDAPYMFYNDDVVLYLDGRWTLFRRVGRVRVD